VVELFYALIIAQVCFLEKQCTKNSSSCLNLQQAVKSILHPVWAQEIVLLVLGFFLVLPCYLKEKMLCFFYQHEKGVDEKCSTKE